MYYVYMIKNTDNKLYVGISENISKRTYCHNTKQSALFTKNKGKFNVVFYEECPRHESNKVVMPEIIIE